MQPMGTGRLKEMLQREREMELINVLPKDQFEKEHIPGSINIPVGANDFADRVQDAVGTKKKTVVVYCASEECDASPKAARMLDDAGFRRVYDYEAGMSAWRDAGLPVEKAH